MYSPLPNRPNDLGVNSYSPAGNGSGSSVEMFTLYDRNPAEQLWNFQTHMNYAGFYTMLRTMGFGIGNNLPSTGHYETPWSTDPVKVGSIITASTGPGTDVVVALHADAMYDTQVTTGGNARQASYPVVGDIIELYDRTQAQITAKNVTVNPHRITLTPLDAAVDLVGKITDGDSYGIPYNLHGEGSGLPKGRAPRVFKYTNTFGIVKHSFGTTGNNLVDAVRYEVIPGDPGSANQSIYVAIKSEEMRRFEQSCSGLLLFGQRADNLVSTDNFQGLDTPVSSTQGFVDFAFSYGNEDGYTAGAYSLDDFDTIGNILRDERATTANDVMCVDGPDIALETENIFSQSINVDFSAYLDRLVPGYATLMAGYQQSLSQGGGADVVSFNYRCIQKNGFNFHITRMDEFADIRVLGSENYIYRKTRIAVPLGWTRDLISGNQRPTIGYEWRQLGEYSRQVVFGDLPGAGVGGNNTPYGKAVTEYDGMKYFLLSELCFHGACANALVVQTPS
jgi:hypothetical protein